MITEESPKFFVKSGDIEFADRQKNVFSMLDEAVKQTELHSEMRREPDYPESKKAARLGYSKRCRSSTKHLRGKESIFKRPEGPPPSSFKWKRRDIPDYQRNPHKWKKYTLGDVSQEEMSDKSNTAAAMAFLRELQAKKDEQMELEIASEAANNQVSFRRPPIRSGDGSGTIIVRMSTDEYPRETEAPSFRSSKLIMPEYVVGQKKPSTKKISTGKQSVEKKKEITLNHLLEEDD